MRILCSKIKEQNQNKMWGGGCIYKLDASVDWLHQELLRVHHLPKQKANFSGMVRLDPLCFIMKRIVSVALWIKEYALVKLISIFNFLYWVYLLPESYVMQWTKMILEIQLWPNGIFTYFRMTAVTLLCLNVLYKNESMTQIANGSCLFTYLCFRNVEGTTENNSKGTMLILVRSLSTCALCNWKFIYSVVSLRYWNLHK